MNTFLRHVIDGLATNLKGVKAIVLRGSQQTNTIVDFWSDTDLLVILQPDIVVDTQKFIHAIHEIGFVIGSERYNGVDSMLYRVAMEFVEGDPKIQQARPLWLKLAGIVATTLFLEVQFCKWFTSLLETIVR